MYWHQGRSLAYGEGISFWALGEMVRRRAGIAERDDAATTDAKLATMVAEFFEDDEERRWIRSRLRGLLGLEDLADARRDELFAAWRRLFERIASRATVVLVFEDLQWADDGQIEFIDSLMEWSRQHPILIVTLARPELFERRPTWGAGPRDFTALHLEPLPTPAMTALVEGLGGGLPAVGRRDDRRAARRESRCMRSNCSGCSSIGAASRGTTVVIAWSAAGISTCPRRSSR